MSPEATVRITPAATLIVSAGFARTGSSQRASDNHAIGYRTGREKIGDLTYDHISCRLRSKSGARLPSSRPRGAASPQPRTDSLAHSPRPRGVKALSGEEGLLRLRVGDYRIIYQVEDHALTVLIPEDRAPP